MEDLNWVSSTDSSIIGIKLQAYKNIFFFLCTNDKNKRAGNMAPIVGRVHFEFKIISLLGQNLFSR